MIDDEYIVVAVVMAAVYLIVRICYWWGKQWKAKATHAYMIIGQRGDSIEECEWGYRNALLAGEQKAMLVLCLCSHAQVHGRATADPESV